jgi:ribulose-5-phosphate 4-epimerase/fuculose-1-phosphate aldolase
MLHAVSETRRPASTSEPEWQLRVELAALHRMFALYGWDDHIFTHISARVPGEPQHMLLTPMGALFSEVDASSLVKTTFDGKPVDERAYLNPAAVVIHGGVYEGAPRVSCVAHLHTVANVAVSAHVDGLLPISQSAMCLTGAIGYHDYEGLAVNFDERERLVAAVGTNKVVVLRNHGSLYCSDSPSEAFLYAFFFERACQFQVAALTAGPGRIRHCTEDVARQTAIDFRRHPEVAKISWTAAIRRVQQALPGFDA